MAEFAKSSTTSFLLNVQYFLNRNFVTRATNSQLNEKKMITKTYRVSETVGETRKIDRLRNSQVPLKTAYAEKVNLTNDRLVRSYYRRFACAA